MQNPSLPGTQRGCCLFQWHLCLSWSFLGDLISSSSNRRLCLWLQASVIAGACDINCSSPWEFSNTSKRSLHSHRFMRQWQYKHVKVCCRWSECVRLHLQSWKWLVLSGLRPNRLRDLQLLKRRHPLWTAGSTRWLFLQGKDSLRDTWGTLRHYLLFSQRTLFNPPSERYSCHISIQGN